MRILLDPEWQAAFEIESVRTAVDVVEAAAKLFKDDSLKTKIDLVHNIGWQDRTSLGSQQQERNGSTCLAA